jgi:hypothetical protein
MSENDDGTGWGPEPAEPNESGYVPVWHNSTTAGPGLWHVPGMGDGSGAWFATESAAERVGHRAYLDALRNHREWHNANDHRPTAGELEVEAHRARKAARLAEGWTEAELAARPDLLQPEPVESGSDLYQQWKSGTFPAKVGDEHRG